MMFNFCCVQIGVAGESIDYNDKKNILNLIRSMYKLKTRNFQGTNIFNRDKSVEEVNIESHCKLLQSYFDSDIVKKRVFQKSPLKTCSFPNSLFDIRYFGYEPFDDMGNFEEPRAMKPLITAPVIHGNEASLTVRVKWKAYNKLENSRADYFLKKKPEGWRIYKVFYGEDSDRYFGGDEKPEEKLTFPTEPWEKDFQ